MNRSIFNTLLLGLLAITSSFVNSQTVPTTVTFPTEGTFLPPGIVTFLGTAPNPSVVTLVLDGNAIGTLNLTVLAGWSFMVNFTAPGNHTVQVVATFDNGESVTSPLVVFAIQGFMISPLSEAIGDKYCP